MSVFPCHSNPTLFDSDQGPDHRDVKQAKAICATCPAQAACLTAGRKGHEYGIWGGESQPERWKALLLPENGPALPPECGTEVGYRRHKLLGEECEECLDAHNVRQRAYAVARRKRDREKRESEMAEIEGSRINPFHAPLRGICGTESGYAAHMRRGELRLTMHPKCTCKEAHRLHRAQQRQKKAKAEVQAA